MKKLILYTFLITAFSSCYEKEELNVPIKQNDTEIETELDRYIEENFTKKYGMAIRYRFVDRYVNPGERVTPPSLEVVRPMLDFIENFWIDPYLEVANGRKFFEENVPAEIVLLGGVIYNGDGTVTLGTADAGAQITFTNVNEINPDDVDWRNLQLQTVYHEFAHTVHQRFKLPNAFETISPGGYTSAGSWFVLENEDAVKRGFVSPYSTSSPNEDFAETVAFYLFDNEFMPNFIEQEAGCSDQDCIDKNAGRLMIEDKLQSIAQHYEKVTGINLLELREAVQSRLE